MVTADGMSNHLFGQVFGHSRWGFDDMAAFATIDRSLKLLFPGE
jgi:hypothetical protein